MARLFWRWITLTAERSIPAPMSPLTLSAMSRTPSGSSTVLTGSLSTAADFLLRQQRVELSGRAVISTPRLMGMLQPLARRRLGLSPRRFLTVPADQSEPEERFL